MNQVANPEFEAFRAVHDALSQLDDEARSRVVKSVITLLAIDAQVASAQDEEVADEADVAAANEAAKGAPTFSNFAELHAASEPTTNAERALVAGYWLQVCEGRENFTGQDANAALNHLGHKIAHITSAFEALKGAKPQLALQLRKSGSSRQARKTFKLSDAGVKRVQEMIGG